MCPCKNSSKARVGLAELVFCGNPVHINIQKRFMVLFECRRPIYKFAMPKMLNISVCFEIRGKRAIVLMGKLESPPPAKARAQGLI